VLLTRSSAPQALGQRKTALIAAGSDGRPQRKTPPRGAAHGVVSTGEIGAGEEIRTLDPNLGKVVLYH
jgi:hypothetical protein